MENIGSSTREHIKYTIIIRMTTLRSSNMATETPIYIYINRPWRLLQKSFINGVFSFCYVLPEGHLKKKDKMWETELLPHHPKWCFVGEVLGSTKW